MRVRKGLLGLAVVFLATVTGCTSGGVDPVDTAGGRSGTSDGKRGTEEPEPERRELKVYDPPRKFDRTSVGSVPEQDGPLLTSALVGKRLFTRTVNGVRITDVSTGKALTGTVRPENDVQIAYQKELRRGTDRVDGLAPFVLERPDGPPLVLAAFHTRTPGRGTTAPRELVELLAVDSGTGKRRGGAAVELRGAYGEKPTSTRVVGAYGQVVVLAVRVHTSSSLGDDFRETVAVDLGDPAKPRTVWRRPAFEAYAVASGHVVGAAPGWVGWAQQYVALTGLDAGDGKQVWQDPHGVGKSGTRPAVDAQTTAAAGPDRVVVSRRAGLDKELLLVDPATGAFTPLLADSATVTCHDDRKATVVCAPREGGAGSGRKTVFAFDARSGKLLWRLPDEKAGRIRPEVTTAWHGRVYGRTSAGPVVLDARTGEDVEVEPGIAPVLVNEYAGLAMRDGSHTKNSGRTPAVPWRMSLHHAVG
ncbi:outer membrane protein assembly factor BamB family protein [Streptomyces cinereoruber]|uniref:outer membrane protein assembly factor BamB family protein n=1 Tax=Streptomyces cinereoruber TaxID=67260 RepID=UPI00362663FD